MDMTKQGILKDTTLLQKILDTTTTMIFWKDTQRRFLGVNQAFLDYYGFSSESELIGKTDEDMGWHSDPDPFKNDEIQVIENGASTYRVHGKCIALGEERDILASKSPMYENGKIVGLVGAFEDVTDEYRWQRENDNFTRILDNVPSGVVVYCKEGTRIFCVYANQFFLDMLGMIDRFMLVGKSYSNVKNLIHPDDVATAKNFVDELLNGAHIQDCTIRYRKVGEMSYAWYHQVCRRVLQIHGDVYYYVSYTDVTAEKEAGVQIRNSQAIYELAIENTGLLLFEFDIARRSVLIEPTPTNLKIAKQYGYKTVMQNVPDSLIEHVRVQDRPAFLAMYDDVRAGKSATCEVWIDEMDNIPAYCLRISYNVVHDEFGGPDKAFGMATNITEEKIKEEKYNTFKSFRKGLIDKALSAFRMNLTGNWCGEGASSNAALLSLQESGTVDGFFAKAVEGMPDEQERNEYKRLFSRKKLLASFETGVASIQLEHRYLLDGMQETWMRVYVDMAENPFTHEIEAVTYNFNIDFEKKNQMIINELVGTDFDFVCLLDLRTGTVTEYGENGNSYYEQNELVDFDYMLAMQDAVKALVRDDMIEEAMRAHGIEAIKENLQNVPIYRLSFPTKDGRTKGWRISYLGDSKSLVLIARSDVTDTVKKEMEQVQLLEKARTRAELANEAKSAFLSNMSHDLRTPLNGVLGFTQLAIQEPDVVKKQEYLRKIKTSGDLLLALINDTLEISRIESGKISLQLDETDSREIGENVINALRPAAELKKISLVAELSKFPQKTIWVDKLKVQKIILNLLSNAIKYTPVGGMVWINIQELKPPVNGCNRRIIVKDTGIGMKQEFLPTIFEPFTQERRPEVANVTGTGLGMSIVKRFVDLMDGTISVHSEINKGTEFIVDLPIARVDEGRCNKKKMEEAQVSLAGKKILLCEDNELNSEIAKTLLKSKGIEVEIAINGQKGCERFQKSAPGEFSAILMDIRMPVMNGYDATETIRHMKRPDAVTIPILAMTADAFAEDIRHAKQVGMNGYITKPVEPDKMFALLVEKIGNKNE